ncbi:sigma factor-like helix-turn-helix DNA-binding protein [Mesorhizobium sp. B3-1-7]|nr:sigma factor-like helix-turn-helix DNA-binding protein [Mesorhizobium sp. B3-1-7]TPI57418.1 hypothetical protein FJ417_21800 [Mesorhizobium sp. B3-1-7]TPJ37123.1 hypothetical protein FJ418_02420 [Mesorhizobium sp. B2-8-3]
MSAEQAEILHLVAVLGFTYSETANLLGVRPGTVMSRPCGAIRQTGKTAA